MLKKLKLLSKSVGEYKKNSVLSMLFVSFEVIMECIIPFVASDLILVIQRNFNNVKLKFLLLDSLNPTGCAAILGGILVVLAMLSLSFGALAGRHCSVASLFALAFLVLQIQPNGQIKTESVLFQTRQK